MTDPLINRDKLEDTIAVALYNQDTILRELTETVLSYLRSVLTPEALTPVELVPHDGYVVKLPATANDLHRRIFGEEPAPPEASKPSRVMWGTRGSASS